MIKLKVTIGVCVRNGESFIKEVIDSILNQDFPHELMEVIFVDDGSEDKTLPIMKSNIHKMDMQVKVFHHEWRGLGATRNVVVYNANGEYIIWVDCDMRLSRDFVRKQVEFMDKNRYVGIGKGRYGLYNVTGLVDYLENIEAIVEFLNCEQKKLSKSLGTGGSIYRTETIRKVGGFDENIKGAGEDVDAEHRIKKAGWSLQITSAEFYEVRRKNWKALWNEYFWHGSGAYVVYNKINPQTMLHKMFPPVAILVVLRRSRNAYKLLYKKVVFLLPLHWTLKRLAWLIGFSTRALNLVKGYATSPGYVQKD